MGWIIAMTCDGFSVLEILSNRRHARFADDAVVQRVAVKRSSHFLVGSGGAFGNPQRMPFKHAPLVRLPR